MTRPSDTNRCGGWKLERDRIALGRLAPALEQGHQPFGIQRRIPALERGHRAPLQTGILRSDRHRGEPAVVDLHRLGLVVERDLVETGTMDDQGPGDAECRQGARHRPDQSGIGDSEQLHGGLGRIEAGPEDVHDRSHPELAADRTGVAQARVVARREAEAHACSNGTARARGGAQARTRGLGHAADP